MFLTRKELSASPQCTQSQDTPVIISSSCELQETAPKGVNVEAARLMSVLGHLRTLQRRPDLVRLVPAPDVVGPVCSTTEFTNSHRRESESRPLCAMNGHLVRTSPYVARFVLVTRLASP
jgi:hypothetical protein